MKRTWIVILCFVLALAVLLGIALLARPAASTEPAEAEDASGQKAEKEFNGMNEAGAVLIELGDGTARAAGYGVSTAGGVVTIGYPGTYRLTGELADGQLVVDLGSFDGAVYLLLDGVSVACADGPALHVKQSDKTVLHLVDGTENTFSDGTDYIVQEKQSENGGAGIYSADDLYIEGGGTLRIYGNSADGIRSRDGLTISGGAVYVWSRDDALQASDYVSVTDGALTLGCYGDGVNVTEGFASISGGTMAVTCAGDGVTAAAELTVTGGEISVTAYGGADNYAKVAMDDISAKGLKAEEIVLSGGVINLDTADDGVHALGDLTLSGGEVTIASGDDALKARGVLTVAGGTVDVTRSYEALEASRVSVEQGYVAASAENNGVSAGEEGFVMTGGLVILSAPRCVSSDGAFSVKGGWLYMSSDGTDVPMAFADGSAAGGSVVLCSATGDTALLTERGQLPGSLLFILPGAVEAGTELTLTDASGAVVSRFDTALDCGSALFAGDILTEGVSYTLTAGDFSLSAAATADGAIVGGATVSQSAQAEQTPAQPAAGGPSGGMRPAFS